MFSPFDSPDNYPTDALSALADLRAYFEGAGMRVDTRAKVRGLHNVRVIEAYMKHNDEWKRRRGDVAGDY